MNSLNPSHHPPVNRSQVTRPQILLFLGVTVLLTLSIGATFLFCLSGRPIETALGIAGVAFAGYLQKEGKRRWNFNEIEAITDSEMDPAYYFDGKSNELFEQMLEILGEVKSRGWDNLDLGEKVDYRNRIKNLLAEEPRLEDYLLTSDTVDNLKLRCNR